MDIKNGYNICTMDVSVAEARNKLTQLLKAVEEGQQITITRHGEPVADLVRTKARKREAPKFGTLSGKGVIVDPNWHKGPETVEEVEAWLEGRFE
jgi:prevent-host-death family protein